MFSRGAGHLAYTHVHEIVELVDHSLVVGLVAVGNARKAIKCISQFVAGKVVSIRQQTALLRCAVEAQDSRADGARPKTLNVEALFRKTVQKNDQY